MARDGAERGDRDVLELHGVPRSNYFAMACTALYEKGLEFRLVTQPPSQEAGWLASSPMGKVPCLVTEAGPLTETQVILDYLEVLAPEPALLPADPFARAKVHELSRTIELYVELAARRLLPAVFFGRELHDVTREEVSAALDRGMAAVRRLARFDPWIAGAQFTQADIVWHYTIGLADEACTRIYGRELLAEIDAAPAHREAVESRASVQRYRALGRQ